MSSSKDSEDQVSLRMIMDKLTFLDSRMEDNFSQLHSQMCELRYEFKDQIDGVKVNIKEIEKSLEHAWAVIKDVQQKAKTNKDSKRSHQDMLDKHTSTIQELQAEIKQIREKYRELEDKRLCWELIKMEIRGLTIAYSKNKAKKQRKSESDLQIRLEELDKQIADSTDSALTNNALTEKEILKQKLQLFYERKANGLILRSKARRTEKGEKPTKYFFNLEKRNYIRKKISELQLSDGKPSRKEDEILKEIERFYEKLYTSKGNIDGNRFENFVRNLELPKLRDVDKEELEGEITTDECKEVLKSFSSGKSSGEDGFTCEFYNCFFELLGEDLINCYNAAY
ncbi:hypothetical protein ACROYT_G004020 [Oculina patagonica]